MNNYERQTIIYRMLSEVYFKKGYSGIVLNSFIEKIGKEDRPFVTKVFYGVMEKNEYLSYATKSLVKSMPKPKIVLILKIALYQLYFTSQQPYAVVSSAVELTKDIGKKEVSGFVNATLKNHDKVRFPQKAKTAEYLSVYGGVPQWLARKLISQYGFDFAYEMLTAHLSEKTHIRLNPDKISSHEIENKLGEFDKSEYGYYVTADRLRLLNGDEYTIQSLSSIKAVHFYLHGLDGGAVLDVCAAPGGKSVLMAQLGNFSVTAGDLHPHRVELIEKYAARMNVSVNAVCNDATKVRGDWRNNFDLVVCDVPCSGIGVINSKPDVLLNRSESDIASLHVTQSAILETSAQYVKKGGRLAYSTCTVLYEENRRVVERFLAKHPEFELDKTGENSGIVEFFPHIDGCDGFFVARMRRIL